MNHDEFIKDPLAVLDYAIDWTAWLDGDTITTSTWTAPTGITVASSSNTTTTATVWLSGGTLDVEYIIVNKIVTAAGRTEPRHIHILMRQK